MLYSTLWTSGLVSWGAGGQCMARSTWPEVGFEHSCIPLLLCYKVSQQNRASYSLVPDSRIPSLHSRSQYQTGNVRVKSRAMFNKVIADFTLLSSLCEHATTVAQRQELHRTLEIYCVQQQKCKRPAVVGNWTLSCATSALSMVEHWLHKPWVQFPVTASLSLSSILPWEHCWLFHREAGILCIIIFFIAILLSLCHKNNREDAEHCKTPSGSYT